MICELFLNHQQRLKFITMTHRTFYLIKVTYNTEHPQHKLLPVITSVIAAVNRHYQETTKFSMEILKLALFHCHKALIAVRVSLKKISPYQQ